MFILHIIKLCALVMHKTISFTLDIYTTTFIVANYYSIDWYFEYVYNCQLYYVFRHLSLYTPVG